MTKAKLKSSARLRRSSVGSRRRRPASAAARVPVSHLVIPGHEAKRGEARAGERIGDFLAREGWSHQRKVDGKLRWTWRIPTICLVNGRPLLQRQWKRRRIAANDNIVFVSRPFGGRGSGKSWAAIGATIALAVFAPWAGGLAASAFFGGSMVAAGVVGGLIALGGNFLISTFLAPKPGGNNERGPTGQVGQLYTVQAQGNTARPLATIPVQYGRLKIVPDYAAAPFSEYEDNDQYLNVLLARGEGKYDVGQVLTDDTVIWDQDTGLNPSFEGVTLAHYDPGEVVDLFPTNIVSAIEVNGQELPNPPTWIGGFIVNAAGTQIAHIAVDLVFPSGCFSVNDEGEIGAATIQILAEYRPVDDAGAPTGGWSSLFSQTYSYKIRKPIRLSRREEVTPGRYEVRVSRGNNAIVKGANAAAWAGLRGNVVDAPQSFPCSTTALRIKANAFTQESARRFGIVQTRILPVWDMETEGWVEQPTRNPFWAFNDAATNTRYGARRPPSKIDFQWIVTQAALAEVNGETFDYQFASPVSVPEAFDTILKPSRCRHRWSGDVLGGIRDEYREIPRMLITDREIIRNSFEIEYALNTDEAADCVIVEYLDEDIWRAAEVQYPPNSETFTGARPARIRLDGVVNRENAFREAAFFYLQATYRRTFISFETEYDGKLLGFGSTVLVQSELPGGYGQSAAVLNKSGLNVLVDREIDWSGPGQHYADFRDKRGRLFGPVKCSEGASADTAVIDGADLALIEAQLSTTLAAALQRAEGAEPPSVSIGVGAARPRNCLVLTGKQSGHRVRLATVVNSEAAYPPDEPSGLPALPELPALRDPVAPVVYQLYASFRQGVAEPILDASWWPAAGAEFYRADVSYDEGESWTPVYEGIEPSLSAVVDRAALRLRVQGVGRRRGAYSTVDVEAPVIKIAPGTVGPQSLVKQLEDFVTRQLVNRQAAFERDIYRISTAVANLDAQNQTELSVSRRTLSVVRGNLSASIDEVLQVAVGIDSAFAQYRIDVAAAFDETNVQVGINAVAIAGVNDTVASLSTFVGVSGGGLSASVSTLQGAMVGVEGHIAAVAGLTLDVNGYVSGYQAYNDGAVSTFTILADVFQIAKPGVTGGGAVPIFQVANVDGTPKIAFRGDMYADGDIYARHLAAGSVTAASLATDVFTAVKANITDLTVENINSFYALYNNLGYNAGVINEHTQRTTSAFGSAGNNTIASDWHVAKIFTAPAPAIFVLASADATGSGSGLGNNGLQLSMRCQVLENGAPVGQDIVIGPTARSASPVLSANAWRIFVVTPGATITVQVRVEIERYWLGNGTGSPIVNHWYADVPVGGMTALALIPNGIS